MGPTGYGWACVRSNWASPPVVSCMSAPRNATPGWLSCAAASTGSSCAQGPHHEAQKLSTTGVPCSLLTSTWPPSAGRIASAGAGRPSSCGLVRAACCRPHPSDSISTDPATTAPPEISAVLAFTPLSLVDHQTLFREGVGGRDPAVEEPARLDRTLQGLAVHLDQAELRRVPASPLEVVDVRPVEVAADVDTVFDRKPDVFEDVGDVVLAAHVVGGGQAVLGHVDRLPEALQLVEHLPHPHRVRAPAHVRELSTRHVEPADELVARPRRIERAHLRPVMGDADEVARGLDDTPQPARGDRPAVDGELSRARRQLVAPLAARRQKQELVMGEAHRRVGPPSLDRGVRELVRVAHVGDHAVEAGEVAVMRGGKLAGDPAVGGVDVRLVDRAPEADQVTELIRHPADKRQERTRGLAVRPAALAREPQGACEVMQGDHGLDALFAKVPEDVAVVSNLAGVELPLRRLDARPLDGQAVRVLVQLAQQLEVLAVAVVVVAGDGRRGAVLDAARLLLELPPVAVPVVAFDLVGGAGGSPEEAVRKAAHAAAPAGLATMGGGVYSQLTGLSPSSSMVSMPALSTDLRYISRSL